MLDAELRFAGDRADVAQKCAEISAHLRTLNLPEGYWDFVEIGRAAKKNFAQRFSNALAQKIANELRPDFPGIFPDASGHGQEKKTRGALGTKKLDVSYSLPEEGLGLAVSVKTINFRDDKTMRYTKNVKRVDGELRAEAQDCHRRQPYAVLAAIVLMPADAANDGVIGGSSLKHAADVYRKRARRRSTDDDHALFELIFMGVYQSSGPEFGVVDFFDVAAVEMPSRGLPPTVKFSSVLQAITAFFQSRNED